MRHINRLIIARDNFGNKFTEPVTLIVIHGSASTNLGSVYFEFNDTKILNSAHFGIETNGSIDQFVPTTHIAYHAGKSQYKGKPGCNNYSIGIELVNIGPLMLCEDDPDYFLNSYKRLYKPSIKPVKIDNMYYEPYTDAQYASLNDLIKFLRKKIPTIEDVVGHNEVAIPNGRKSDPWPVFDWSRIK